VDTWADPYQEVAGISLLFTPLFTLFDWMIFLETI